MRLEDQKAARVEYRIKWKDDGPDSWCALRIPCVMRLVISVWLGADRRLGVRREPARNVAEDVLREFESRWWSSARKGDVADLADMLAGGREVLATTVDDNGRTCVLRGAPAARSLRRPPRTSRGKHAT